MLAAFPATNPAPEPLARFFAWQQAQGLTRASQRDNGEYGLIVDGQERTSLITVEPERDFMKYWTGNDDPALADRVVVFFRIGGDGSHAGLWVDDAGQQHIVALGSGSGSTLSGIMASDPVDFLRLLAIGYEELCWPEAYGQSPAEIFADEYLADAGDPGFEQEDFPDPTPVALRAFLAENFGASVPETAAEIITSPIAEMDVDDSDDPFWRWVDSVRK